MINKGGSNFFCGHLALFILIEAFKQFKERKNQKKRSRPAFSIFYSGTIEKLLFTQKALCPFKISFFCLQQKRNFESEFFEN
jgi:hypothetical protein